LNLFGSVMFPNNSADSVLAVYFTFLDDMLNVPEDDYDWGQATICYRMNTDEHLSQPLPTVVFCYNILDQSTNCCVLFLI
jgi:hypothetical protein